jgi:hypothetical protein
MVLTKRHWILIGLIVLLLGGTLIYFGWTKQKSEPATRQSKQSKPEATRQIMIPSSLDSQHVIVDFARYMHLFGEMITRESSFWVKHFGIVHPNERFIEGTAAAWHGTVYLTKQGREIEGADDSSSFIVIFAVLKYEKPEFAREDYDKISPKQQFTDATLEGISLKTKLGMPLGISKRPYMMNVEPEQCQQYLLWSSNFIIYAFGLKQAAEDVMIRVIDRYAVE